MLTLILLVGCQGRTGRVSVDLPEGPVYLIVNGDDTAMDERMTDAALAAYFDGKISSVSLFVPGQDIDRTLAILRENPEYPVGVHLTLTGRESPLTQGKSLGPQAGIFWRTSEQVSLFVDAVEAKAEWAAQIQYVLDAGIAVSHLDGHMGCFFLTPALFNAARDLSHEFKIPLITPFYPELMPQEWKREFPLASNSGMYTLSHGVPESLENRTRAYRELLGSLPPGVHYIFTHPGMYEPGDRVIDHALRRNDYLFWTSDETHKWLGEQGFVLVPATTLEYRR